MDRIRLVSWWCAVAVAVAAVPGGPVAASPASLAAVAPVAAPVYQLDEVVAGAQATIDKRAAALIAKDEAAFTATMDPNARTLRRYAGEQFKSIGGRGFVSYQAVRAKEARAGLYKVWIRNNSDSEAVWVFRNVGGQWLLTEPTETELGQRTIKDTDHFRFRYFEWDNDIIDPMVETLERAYARVTDALAMVPPDKTLVYLTPALSLNPHLQKPGVVASAFVEDRVINMHSAETYAAGFYSQSEGPFGQMYPTITHEYTHIVTRYYAPVARMKGWMYEGVAEYTSGSFNTPLVSQAIQRNRMLTLEQAHEAIFFGEEKGYTFSQSVLGYGIGSYATRYIYETWGGPAFWQMAKTYATTQSLNDATQTALGVSYEELQARFSDWLPGAVKADQGAG